jgi:hypothetical protein
MEANGSSKPPHPWIGDPLDCFSPKFQIFQTSGLNHHAIISPLKIKNKTLMNLWLDAIPWIGLLSAHAGPRNGQGALGAYKRGWKWKTNVAFVDPEST